MWVRRLVMRHALNFPITLPIRSTHGDALGGLIIATFENSTHIDFCYLNLDLKSGTGFSKTNANIDISSVSYLLTLVIGMRLLPRYSLYAFSREPLHSLLVL